VAGSVGGSFEEHRINVGIALATGILFGLWPALQLSGRKSTRSCSLERAKLPEASTVAAPTARSSPDKSP